MVIRCSLLGHDYGEPETVREREERGSEVVTTVREVEECTRCGRENVVSENKEVTAIRDPEAEATDAAGGNEPATESETAVGEMIADAEPDGDATTDYEADEDDGVILDDEDGAELDRSYGQWPEQESATETDEDEAEADSPSPWPAVDESADEGFDAEAGGGEATDVEFGGGLAPERAATEEGDDAEFIEGSDSGGQVDADSPYTDSHEDPASDAGVDDAGFDDVGFTRSGSAPAPGQPQSDADTEFVCPACGHTQASSGSSLRAGDICPECRRGYISERER